MNNNIFLFDKIIDYYFLLKKSLLEKNYNLANILVKNNITMPKNKKNFFEEIDDEIIYQKYIQIYTEIKLKKNYEFGKAAELNASFHLKLEKNISLVQIIEKLVLSEHELKFRLLSDIIDSPGTKLDKNISQISKIIFENYLSTKDPKYIFLYFNLGNKLSSFYKYIEKIVQGKTLLGLALKSDENNFLRTKILKKIFLSEIEIELFLRMKSFNIEDIKKFYQICDY